MKFLIASFLVFVIFACFGAGGTQTQVTAKPLPNIPEGYTIIAPAEVPAAKQNSGGSTLLMFWGLFTIFLFVLMFS